MKKAISILSIIFCVAFLSSSCSSDESFDEISANAQLDQEAPIDPGSKSKPGGS